MRCAYRMSHGISCIQPPIAVLVQVECKVGSNRHLRLTVVPIIPATHQTLTLLSIVSCKQITR